MKKLLGIVVLGLLWCNVVFADWILKGALAHSCGKMVKAHENNWKPHMDNYKHGVLGFITGMNFAIGKQAGKGIDEDALYYEVLNYCKKNPVHDVFDGAFKTWEKLK